MSLNQCRSGRDGMLVENKEGSTVPAAMECDEGGQFIFLEKCRSISGECPCVVSGLPMCLVVKKPAECKILVNRKDRTTIH
jgi:hypothetical protein